MPPRRTWPQTGLTEAGVGSRQPWGTKVKSSAHKQKGYRIDRDTYFCIGCTEAQRSHCARWIVARNVIAILQCCVATWCKKYMIAHVSESHTLFARCHRPLNTHCVLVSSPHVDSESISLKNLKRRSEFFEKGKKMKRNEKRGDSSIFSAWWLAFPASVLLVSWKSAACFALVVSSSCHFVITCQN